MTIVSKNDNKRNIARVLICLVSAMVLVISVSVFKPKRVLFFLSIHLILFGVYYFVRKRKLPTPFSDKKSTVFASLAAIFVFFDFFINAESIKPKKLLFISSLIQKVVPFSYEWVIAFISLILGAISFYFLYVCADVFSNKGKVLIVIAKRYKYHICALFILYFISFLSMMRANYYYIDDIGRTISGNDLTGGFSRYLSNAFAEAINTNVWLADLSPITQLIALLILAYAGAIVLYMIHGNTPPKVFHVAALIPMGLSPYFLSCLSFKFDSPFMAFSILISIIPLLFYRKTWWKYGIVVYIATLCMCTTYQASSGIFPAGVLLLAFFMWAKKKAWKGIILFVGVSASAYMMALLSFRFLLMEPIGDSYVNTSITFRHLFSNIANYVSSLWNDYGVVWKLCLLVVVITFFVNVVLQTKRNRGVTAALLVVTLFGVTVFSYGANVVFEVPTLDARGIYSIGVLIAIISAKTLSLDKRFISVGAVVLLGWMCVAFAVIYGNALDLQKNYTAYRMEQVLDDINEERLLEDRDNLELRFAGSEGVSSSVQNLMQQYPILKRLMPTLFDDRQPYYWGPRQFCGFYDNALKQVKVLYGDDYDLSEYTLVKQTTNHSIYNKENGILVYFHSISKEQ